jgi:hypothetical protein
MERNHETFSTLTDSYKIKYADIAVVHPFCVCHQNVRKLILNKTRIDGKPVQTETLVCRSRAMGGIEYDREAMAHLKLTKDRVNKLLGDNACLYTMHIDDELL